MKLFTSAALALVLAAGAAASANAQNQTYNPDSHPVGQGGGQHTAGNPGGRAQSGPPAGGGQHTAPPATGGANNGAQHGNGGAGGQHGPGGPGSGAGQHGAGNGQGDNGQHGNGSSGGNGQHGNGHDNGHWNNGQNGGGHVGNGGALQFQNHPLRGRDHGRGWYDPGRFAQHYWAHQRFHIGFWRRPPGWYAHSWTYGMFLPLAWYQSDYYLDWAGYDLPTPPVGCEWVREGNDALLIDVYTGQVLSVYQGLFW